MENIFESIHSFRVYSNGDIVGVGEEISLPAIENKTTTISGAGILGEIDSVAEGHVSAMGQELPFNALSPEYFDVVEKINKGADITIRGALQYRDAATGTKNTMGIKVTERGTVKTITPGSIKNAEAMSSGMTVNLNYLKIEIDGKEKLEIDKLNMIYKVNGVDLLKKIRDLC